MRISSAQSEIYGINEESSEIPPLDDILKIQKEDYVKDYHIRYSDIDSNGNVNNVKYMEMASYQIFEDILINYMLPFDRDMGKHYIHHLLENSIIHYNYWNFGELLYNTISLIDEYHVFERR